MYLQEQEPAGKRETLGAVSRATQGEKEKARERTVNTTVSVPVLAESGSSISDFTLQVCVSGTPASCLVDTGAVVSLIRPLGQSTEY